MPKPDAVEVFKEVVAGELPYISAERSRIILQNPSKAAIDACLNEESKRLFHKGQYRREDVHEVLAKMGLHEAFDHHQDTEAILKWLALAALVTCQVNKSQDVRKSVNTPERVLFAAVAMGVGHVHVLLSRRNSTSTIKAVDFVGLSTAPERTLREITPSFLAIMGVHEEAIAGFCYDRDLVMNSYSGRDELAFVVGEPYTTSGIVIPNHAAMALS